MARCVEKRRCFAALDLHSLTSHPLALLTPPKNVAVCAVVVTAAFPPMSHPQVYIAAESDDAAEWSFGEYPPFAK